jgi:hypothetical protein
MHSYMHSRSRAARPAVANQPESVSPDQPDQNQNDVGVFENPMAATESPETLLVSPSRPNKRMSFPLYATYKQGTWV